MELSWTVAANIAIKLTTMRDAAEHMANTKYDNFALVHRRGQGSNWGVEG